MTDDDPAHLSVTSEPVLWQSLSDPRKVYFTEQDCPVNYRPLFAEAQTYPEVLEQCAWIVLQLIPAGTINRSKCVDEILRITPSTPTEPREELLTQFANHLNWELDWGPLDEYDETAECGWRVHSVNGSPNDREWNMIGTGETPQEAILSALKDKKQ